MRPVFVFPGEELEERDVIRAQVWLSHLENPASTDTSRPNFLNPLKVTSHRTTHGDFGTAFESAIKDFQTQQGLDATGKMDNQTWFALQQAYYAKFDPCGIHVGMGNPTRNPVDTLSAGFGHLRR